MSENGFECFPKREISEDEDHGELLQANYWRTIPIDPGRGEISGLKLVKHETLLKQELYEDGHCEMPVDGNEVSNISHSSMEMTDVEKGALVGKIKVRPLALLAEPLLLQAIQNNEGLNNDSNTAAVACHSSLALNTPSPSPALETTIISSEASTRIKEEFELGNASDSNVIVKPELDLGVSGDDLEQSIENDLNSSSKGDVTRERQIMTSDSICHNKNNVVEPYHGVERSDLIPWAKEKGKRLCKVCDYRHDSVEKIEIHTSKLHTAKYNYRCFICAAAAYKHKISPYTLTSYQCRSYRALEYHVAVDHRRLKWFMCSACDRHFKTKQARENHEAKAHKMEPVTHIKPFACQICSYSYSNSSLLEKHVFNIHDETPVECGLCSKIVKQSRMKAHMWDHKRQSDPRFKRKCGKCDFVTFTQSLLRKHFLLTSHHLEYHCLYCKKFASNSEKDFKKHSKSCRPYFCTFGGCDKVFYEERRFISHSRLHSLPLEKLHTCAEEACDFQTQVKVQLTRHYRKTRHNLPCQCPHCPARYSAAEHVTNHLLKVHVDQIVQQSEMSVQNEEDSEMTSSQNDTVDGVSHDDEHIPVGPAVPEMPWAESSHIDPEMSTIECSPDVSYFSNQVGCSPE